MPNEVRPHILEASLANALGVPTNFHDRIRRATAYASLPNHPLEALDTPADFLSRQEVKGRAGNANFNGESRSVAIIEAGSVDIDEALRLGMEVILLGVSYEDSDEGEAQGYNFTTSYHKEYPYIKYPVYKASRGKKGQISAGNITVALYEDEYYGLQDESGESNLASAHVRIGETEIEGGIINGVVILGNTVEEVTPLMEDKRIELAEAALTVGQDLEDHIRSEANSVNAFDDPEAWDYDKDEW